MCCVGVDMKVFMWLGWRLGVLGSGMVEKDVGIGIGMLIWGWEMGKVEVWNREKYRNLEGNVVVGVVLS